MKLRSLQITMLAALGMLLAFGTVSAKDNSGEKAVREFWNVWRGKKSTNLDKNKAVQDLIGGKELVEPYLDILESDTWQYRSTVIQRVQGETNQELLNGLADFLFDEKEVSRKPAAGEHLVWALYNNRTWATPENWQRAKELVLAKRVPDKVKARMLRVLGDVFHGPSDVENKDKQALAKQNVRTLVACLEWAMDSRKTNPQLRFLVGDSLENLTSKDFGDDLAKWRFFADNLKEGEALTPRKANNFDDEYGNVKIEGHSFSSPTPRPVTLEILILPDLGKSDKYWYPYIFKLNKTFKCTFVKLPDCSRVKDLKWMKNRDGSINRTAYYYPLKQLVEAFEERRKASKQKHIGLIADGVSGWIALEYLRLHPESVAFAVINETWSGAQSRELARNTMGNNKEDCYKYFAEDLVYDPSGRSGSLSLNPEQKFYSQTGAYKRRWADPKALEPIFYASRPWNEPVGGNARILVPDYNFQEAARGQRINVPTLFCMGTQDPMYPKKDRNIYSKVFTKMVWEDFKESSATPWAEEPVHFFDAFQKMLDKNDIIAKLKKEEEEAKKKGN